MVNNLARFDPPAGMRDKVDLVCSRIAERVKNIVFEQFDVGFERAPRVLTAAIDLCALFPQRGGDSPPVSDFVVVAIALAVDQDNRVLSGAAATHLSWDGPSWSARSACV